MTEPIQFFNRYSGQLEHESVYGDRWLKWTYGNPLGKLCLHAFIKRAAFSRWYGRRMDHPSSREKIEPFIRDFRVDATEFLGSVDSFTTFNEFFYRRLKPEARPVDPAESAAVFPADGRHLGFQDYSKVDGILVKGQRFSLEDFLGDAELAKRYAEGAMLISRLCPVDYHRFHFPVGGHARRPHLINGPLYSVNPIALRQNIRIFSENKREVTLVDSPEFGQVAVVEVGATCVGGIVQTFTPDDVVAKGAEKGYFKFGGSSLATLFEKGRIQLADDLLEQTRGGRELYARMGDRLGLRPAT